MVSALVLGCVFGAATVGGPAPADLAAYQEAKAAAGRDADAHVALALWCEAHGMAAEKSKHLARAVLLDPSNVKARGLLGFVNHDGRWVRPEEVARGVEESPEQQALFREYMAKRARTRDRADDQWALAKWCEEKGLAQQATAHFHRVAQLDPGRESAWKHLGFVKSPGGWAKPEALAAAKLDREAQSKADKVWKPKLERLKEALSSKSQKKRAEAEKTLAAIDDPRAVPMVWRVFVAGDERWHHVASRIFSQIDAPRSSASLGMLAVLSPRADVRAEAAQVLKRRDPRDFAGVLISLLGDEIDYKIKPVNGPGSPGRLMVKGKDLNVDRRYTPFDLPTLLPSDLVQFDQSGSPYATRYLASSMGMMPMMPSLLSQPQVAATPSIAPGLQALAPALGSAGLTPQQGQQLLQSISTPAKGTTGAAGSGGGVAGTATVFVQRIPIGQMIAEARMSALIAQQQLQQDAMMIDVHNAPIRELNERVQAVLKSVRGGDGADADRESWLKWFADLQGYAFVSPPVDPTPPPTFVEEVPIQAPRTARPITTAQTVTVFAGGGPSPSTIPYKSPPAPTMPAPMHHHCLAAGTQIQTLLGSQPIEEIRAGDQVLSQDMTSGGLRYRPVVTIYHNPPNETYKLDLGTESIVATGIHRFWKAGRGWVMARDVKAGDQLRTIGGTVTVVSATKDKVQPVFNLQLDGGDDFCVGALGVIAHDNSFVDPVDHPFDDVPALADLKIKTARTP